MEKQLRENGDKLDSADKETVQHEIDEFKKVREGGDTEAIKNAMESMTQKVYQIFGKIYQQEGGQPGRLVRARRSTRTAPSTPTRK